MTAWLLGANVHLKGPQAGLTCALNSESKKVIKMLSPSKTEAGVMSHAESNTRWKSLYRIGGVAALFGVDLLWPHDAWRRPSITLAEISREEPL